MGINVDVQNETSDVERYHFGRPMDHHDWRATIISDLREVRKHGWRDPAKLERKVTLLDHRVLRRAADGESLIARIDALRDLLKDVVHALSEHESEHPPEFGRSRADAGHVLFRLGDQRGSVEDLIRGIAERWKRRGPDGVEVSLSAEGWRKHQEPLLYDCFAEHVERQLELRAVNQDDSDAAGRAVSPGRAWTIIRRSMNVAEYSRELEIIDRAIESTDNRAVMHRIVIAENQDRSLSDISRIAEFGDPGPADLIEYAGATTLPLIRAIVRADRQVRLLMKHPSTVEPVQRARMLTTLDTLYTSIFENYKQDWEVRCYKLPYSMRARRIGNEIMEIGWLTPDPKRATAFGHGNPSLVFEPAEHPVLADFFERTFATLWDDPSSDDGADVLASMQK